MYSTYHHGSVGYYDDDDAHKGLMALYARMCGMYVLKALYTRIRSIMHIMALNGNLEL